MDTWDVVSSIQDLGNSMIDLLLPEEAEAYCPSIRPRPFQAIEERTRSGTTCGQECKELESSSLLTTSREKSFTESKLPIHLGRDLAKGSKVDMKFVPAWRRENIDYRKYLRKKMEGI